MRNGSGRLSYGLVRRVVMLCVAFRFVLISGSVQAVTFETMNGAPVQMQPYVDEPGAPAITIPPGTPQPFSGLPGTPNTGGGPTPATGGEALNTMLETSWGADAAAAAQVIGVNPAALAATCVAETGCRSIAGPGTVSGAFQMTNTTYTNDINQVVAQNPQLAGIVDTSLAGKMDPANQAYAAAQDLKNAAAQLQSLGISNPTVSDVRTVFQWGAGAGPNVATAQDSATMSSVLSGYYAPAQLAANGVTSTTTVGQWRASFASKVGSAAGQTVLLN